MKIKLRLHCLAAMLFRYGIAWAVSRHLHIPLQDTLLAVLLYTATWSDTQTYFHFKPTAVANGGRDGKEFHFTDLPTDPQENPTHVRTLDHNSQAALQGVLRFHGEAKSHSQRSV